MQETSSKSMRINFRQKTQKFVELNNIFAIRRRRNEKIIRTNERTK